MTPVNREGRVTVADVLIRALAEAYAQVDALRAQLAALQAKPDPPEEAP